MFNNDKDLIQEIYDQFASRYNINNWSELGRKLGLKSIGYPRLISTGERKLSDNIWIRLEFCGMNPAWRHNQNQAFWSDKITVSREAQELLNALPSLSDEDIAFLLRQARLLANSNHSS